MKRRERGHMGWESQRYKLLGVRSTAKMFVQHRECGQYFVVIVDGAYLTFKNCVFKEV